MAFLRLAEVAGEGEHSLSHPWRNTLPLMNMATAPSSSSHWERNQPKHCSPALHRTPGCWLATPDPMSGREEEQAGLCLPFRSCLVYYSNLLFAGVGSTCSSLSTWLGCRCCLYNNRFILPRQCWLPVLLLPLSRMKTTIPTPPPVAQNTGILSLRTESKSSSSVNRT